ncbi:hypothetical protein OS493_033151 [Desmophyllum pertusum]|uniref:Uncharacterized protein n=1 Tax=Desmophyllum pertusum TaxID=174260 RepID=A0A9W9YIZ4_9CNID|nr:hypothetical protein OS493_033151 [Desmophyllum pertusum]
MLVLKINPCFCFGAALDVFKCSFVEYFCKARTCTTWFYKSLHQDPSADCGHRYEQMLRCLRVNFDHCKGQKPIFVSAFQLHTLRSIFKKKTFCSDANLVIPPRNDDLSDSSAYFQKAPLYGETLCQKFATNQSSDSSLSSEAAKAKKCVKDVLASECKLDAETVMEANNLTLSDHNPFCSNNRNSRATGLEVCHNFTMFTFSSTQPPSSIPVLAKTPALKHRRKDGRKRTCTCPCKRSRSRSRSRKRFPTRPVTRP